MQWRFYVAKGKCFRVSVCVLVNTINGKTRKGREVNVQSRYHHYLIN